MTKQIKDRTIHDLASKAGVNIDAIRFGGKHIVVYVSKGVNKGVVTVSNTCGDVRVFKNIVTDMRKAVR